MVQSSVHEKVAKISARQAVAVALISAAAGVAGALISSGTYSTSKQPPVAATQLPVATQPPVATQHYLTIRSVGAGSHTDYVGFRIVVEVNGQAYSYPSRAVWNSFDSDMASEAFPLPLSQHEYWVRFEAFCRTNTDDVTHLINQEQHQIPESALPISRDYQLHRLSLGTRGGIRGVSPPEDRREMGEHTGVQKVADQLQIKYEIR